MADSRRPLSIDAKLRGYEAHHDWVLASWRHAAAPRPKPYFRVAFLTTGADRALHILHWARHCVRNHDRRLCYAST